MTTDMKFFKFSSVHQKFQDNTLSWTTSISFHIICSSLFAVIHLFGAVHSSAAVTGLPSLARVQLQVNSWDLWWIE
jgi:hypothetical protein